MRLTRLGEGYGNLTSTGEQHQSQYEALIESAPDAVIVIDADGRVVLANAAAVRLFGYDRSQLVGLGVEELLPERFRARHLQHRDAYLRDPRPRPMGVGLELWARRRDGSEVPIDVSLSTIEGEHGPLATAFVRDVTDSKAAQRALSESEQRFALLVSSIADYAIFMLDPAGKILTWNDGAARMKGYSAEEIIGRHFSVFYPREDVEAGKPDRELELARERGLVKDEGWRTRRDGTRFWADVSISALRNDDGSIRGFAKVTRDMSDRHEADARMRSVGEITQALLQGQPTADVLHLVARAARQLARGSAAWVATREPEDGSFVVRATDGRRADVLLGRVGPSERSLAAETVRSGKSLLVSDLSGEERVPRDVREMGLGPAVFVPLSAEDRQLGLLVVAGDRFAPPFTPRRVGLIELFAAQAAVAISHSEARAELERMGMVEERERIARNLHDTVIQRLFATGMTLQATAPLVNGGEGRARLERAVDDLDTTIRAIRTTIFELGVQRRASPGVRRQILEIVSESTANLGFDPTVRFEGPIDARVSEKVAAQLLPTLHEALSNVVRHAHATQLEVLVDASESVILRVSDNGVGFDASSASTGNGLRNMGERASALGGRLDLTANAGGGTVLTWRVPQGR